MLSIVFFSSRTLPGHEYAIKTLRTAGVIAVIGLPCEAVNSLRKCSIKSGMSSRRSRSGGSLTLTTLSR